MPIRRMKYITREFIRGNRGMIFVFGDNEKREGYGGQAAEMRGEPNSVGVRTKRCPGIGENAYWSDGLLETNMDLVDKDFRKVEGYLKNGVTVVIPTDGLGTGLSALASRAPTTLDYINQWIEDLEDQYGKSQG